MGLRTARMVYRSNASPVLITLYPMVHVGDAGFYQQTYEDAFSHDVVLLEGIQSPVVRNLTRSYKWLNFETLGLVRQPKAPLQEDVPARIVNADLNPEEFHREWRKLSIFNRATIFVCAPFIGLYRRFFATRAGLARSLSLEDLRSADEILNWNPKSEPFMHSILHARDQRLIECLVAEVNSGTVKRIAVIFGARHMRAVLRELANQGFKSSESSWRTVISA